MKKTSCVSFSLAPLVHLYKRRVSVVPSEFCPTTIVQEKEQEQEQEQLSEASQPIVNLISSSFVCFEKYIESPSTALLEPLSLNLSALTISLPKMAYELEDIDTLPAYDLSPMSPSVLREFKIQRKIEKEACTNALEEALIHFNQSITPAWQRTPASVCPTSSPLSMSPLPSSV